jgi:hypothetical protein
MNYDQQEHLKNKVEKCLKNKTELNPISITNGNLSNPSIEVQCLQTPKTSFILEFHEGTLNVNNGDDDKIFDPPLLSIPYSDLDNIDNISHIICEHLTKFLKTKCKDKVK